MKIDTPPSAQNQSLTTNAGTPLHITLTASDPDPGDAISYGIVGGPVHGSLSGTAPALTYMPAPGYNGPDSFTFMASDGYFDSNTATVSIHVNGPPVLAVDRAAVTVNEGQTATNTGTISDPDGDTAALAASVGAVHNNGDGTWSWSWPTKDGPADSQTVKISADDGHGGTATAKFALTVQNVAPACGPITLPAAPVSTCTSVTVSAPFTDPGVLDTHSAVWSWGDGKSTAGMVSESNGSGTVAGAHTYACAGLYTVSLKETDKDGASGTCTATQRVIVYNSCKGCVCGYGAIDSPAGAFPKNPKAAGKATFSFSARLARSKKGYVPMGITQFQLQSGGLLFASRSVDWLHVAGGWAQFQGTGTVNCMRGYRFWVTAIDGNAPGGGGMDKVRIRIVQIASGTVIYDNQIGDTNPLQLSMAATALSSGNIVIH